MEGQTTTLAEALSEVQRLIRMGDYRHAGGITYQLIEQAPDAPPVMALHGIVLHRLGRHAEGAPFLERAIEAGPEGAMRVRLVNELAQLRIDQGRVEDALDVLAKGLENDPDAPILVGTRAEALLYVGKRDEAESLVQGAIDRGVNHIAVAMALGRMRLRQGDPLPAIDALKPLVEQPGLSAAQLAQALGRLGDLYDRAGQYDEAFACHRRAANLVPADFDARAHAKVVDSVIQNWTAPNIAKVKRPENTARCPVFIVGMPRSGTSLIEQILSAHPDVLACGELDSIAHIARKGLGASTATFRPVVERPNNLKGKPLEIGARMYENALRVAQKREADRRGVEQTKELPLRTTDKQPLNFYHLGIIALMFPGAHVIHCTRDPRDTCLSCYFSNFSSYHPYAYDLEDLAAYYRDYDRLMKHWTSVLPGAPVNLKMHEVNYETLVGDLEGQTRSLLDFLGLDFNDACLRFFESDHVARTLSNDQVRQPLYASSVGRHKHYAGHIKALTEGLAGLLPAGA